MIGKIKTYIKQNQAHLQYVRSVEPQNDKWTGTVDYAVARFNTVLLKLINTPLDLDRHWLDIQECQSILNGFVEHIRRYHKWPTWMRWYNHLMIHYTGKFKIPRIKKLLNNLR